MKPDSEDRASMILQERCGRWTVVELTGSRTLRVFDIAWGRDMGDEFDHITTNISPGPKEPHTVDFFFTSDITRIVDAETGNLLFGKEEKGRPLSITANSGELTLPFVADC